MVLRACRQQQQLVVLSCRTYGCAQVILSIPESLAVTQIDAEKQELVGEVAGASSELIALTLWLMAERAKGPASAYSGLISMLPVGALACCIAACSSAASCTCIHVCM